MHTYARLLLLGLALPACAPDNKNPSPNATGDSDTGEAGGDDGTPDNTVEDADGDGVPSADDCDDTDATSTILADDADCDGTLTADDCDDTDPSSLTRADDADCDGTLTADDCDDTDATSTILADDADCDGTLTADDCDDTDATSTILADDADCDGTLTADDCDDTDATSTTRADDADCDRTLTADDCDDTDALLGPRAEDADCDGARTVDDCNDADTSLGARAEDADCDGARTVDDCDDADPIVYPGAPEVGLALLEDRACDGGGGSLALADFGFIGENPWDIGGYSVNAAGDVDGDGLDDLFVGAYENDDGGSKAGKAYLLLGSTLAASTASTIDLSQADFAFIGESSGDSAGYSVSTAGDVDGDGLDDLFIGAPYNGDGASYAGKAYLLLGSTVLASTSSTIDLSQADFAFIGENSDDQAGISLSPAGDIDGDGRDDLFVGAWGNDDGGSNAGKAYLLLGSTLAASASSTIDLNQADFAFIGESSGDSAGYSVSTAGDVDGDGLDDLFIGAPYNGDGASYAGKAYLLLGSTVLASTSSTIDLSQADFAFIGENSDDQAGISLSPAGDTDGDGLDDLLMGAHKNDDGGSNAGKAYLILGSSLAASTASTIDLSNADFAFIGESSFDYSCSSVSSAGDVDGDGLDDLFMGAYENDNGGRGTGTAYLILGRTLAASTASTIDLSDADFAFYGEYENDWAGYSVSSAGDVNGDGLDDLFVAAPYNNDGGTLTGKAYVILSRM